MEHVDWLHPDHIILSNPSISTIYKDFTRDMRSREYSCLRMLKTNFNSKEPDKLFIRYIIGNSSFWYGCEIMQKKGKDYYIFTSYVMDYTLLEKTYVKFDREEKLNELLK